MTERGLKDQQKIITYSLEGINDKMGIKFEIIRMS